MALVLRTALGSVHPFLLFLCCYHSRPFFDTYRPFLRNMSVFDFSAQRVQTSDCLLMWSCALQFISDERRQSLVDDLHAVRSQLQGGSISSFDRVFHSYL